jgi:cyanate permease
MRINRSNRAIVFGQRLAEPAASPFLVGMVYDVRGSYTPAFFALAAFSVLTANSLIFRQSTGAKLAYRLAFEGRSL